MKSTPAAKRVTIEADLSTSVEAPGVAMPAWAFLIAATSLFIWLVIAHVVWIVQVTYGPATSELRGAGWNLVWGLLAVAFLVLACLNQYWGLRAMRSRGSASAGTYFAIMLCSGLAAMGIQMLGVACSLAADPLVYDFTESAGLFRPAKTGSGAVATIPGDPAEGRKLFAMTCVTCHGPGGDGLSNLAPSLRTSEFIKSATPADITRVVRLGRAVNDPANKSGKVMPARGGNPFLTDQQVAHLVAFVKSLPDGAPAFASTPGEAGPPVPQLTGWVVPAAAAPPAGLVPLNSAKDLLGTEAFERVAQTRRTALIKSLGLSAMIVHGLFLSALFLCSAEIVFGWLLGVRDAIASSWLQVVSSGWLVALFTWIILGWLFRTV